ncbi:MAG: tRNA (N(6)-L-threonylcarbamoyladenosine(37)-C(2))-methylthiotransferase MtaB [Candidatus Cloacimonadota bacterium]|nr:tRNA (N(6)-L-threonylcarbamoyladenosine(37)-C(2))-methylthiotransferase MtaB [Candidatus Cloacimonadota bacterium]
MKKISVITHGCKTNQYETEAILGDFIESGYSLVNFSNKSDVIIVNCCCVTNKAEAKSRHSIRKALRQKSSDTKLIVTGCIGERNKQFLDENKKYLTFFSNREKPNICSFISSGIRKDEIRRDVFPEMSLQDSYQRTRVPIKIQDGCDFFCSYCILPIVRGKPVSRDPENILSEVQNLIERGVKEIILTGINLGLYGREFNNFNLKNLLELLSDKTEIKLIRLSSMEPMFFTNVFIEYIAKNDKICPHFHISLQNGSDRILKAMNRNYLTSEFTSTIKYLENAVPNCAIGCDVIVGFPGETEEDFQQTYSFIESLNISYLHVFRFSKRPGTKAAQMGNLVSEKIKKERMENLIKLGAKKKMDYTKNLLQMKIPVRAILEKKQKGFWKAVSDHYVPIFLKDKNYKSGDLVHVIPQKLRNNSDGILVMRNNIHSKNNKKTL